MNRKINKIQAFQTSIGRPNAFNNGQMKYHTANRNVKFEDIQNKTNIGKTSNT